MVLKVSGVAVSWAIWLLIFGGMLSFALGLTVRRSDAALGTGIAIASVIAFALGVLLVWVRSRMQEPPPPR